MKQRKIAFSYRPASTSTGGILASYLIESPETTQEKIMETVEMCWLSAALLDAEEPNATETYIKNVKKMLKHIRLLTDLHKFDKQRVWDIIEAELRDYNSTQTNDEKLDKIIEMLENGTPVKVGENNESDSDNNLNKEQKETTAKDFLMSTGY